MQRIAATPPMGWNSWNTFTWNISDSLIRETAKALVDKGYRDCGYEYVVIDDCWSLKERDGNGFLVPDPEKFPEGIKPVADYVHSLGLKFGMYSCAGTHTCAGYPGSFEHEFQDAETFAEWGVDFLKYDYCYKPRQVVGEILYKRMGLALKNCGREILFSACNWGADNVYDWIRESGAHMYRSTGDIQDNWESVKSLALSQMGKESFTGNFCHNDMDMLIVGMYGGSNNDFIRAKIGGCTDNEYKVHFALWAIMGSPLMMGCDIRNASEAAREILQNRDIISINQDIEARGAYKIKAAPDWLNEDECFILVKLLADGELAIGIFNLSEDAREISVQLWDLGLPYASGRKLELYDCYEHKVIGTVSERFSPTVQPHDCVVVKGRLVKA